MNYKHVKKSIDKRLEGGAERLTLIISKPAQRALKYIIKNRPELKSKTTAIETLLIEEQRRLKDKK